MPKEIIVIQRGRGNALLYDGYQYHRKKCYKKTENAEYWKCALNKSTKCVGSVTTKDRTSILKEVAHSEQCLRDVAKNEVDVRLSQCRDQIAANLEIPVPTIFENTVASIEDDGLDIVAKIPNFQNIKTALYNHRNKAAGTNMMFFKKLLDVEVPAAYKEFLIADYNDEGRILIFGKQWAKDLMAQNSDFFIDGTFEICPEPFTQLVTIHCDVGSTMETTAIFPTAYALLPDKTYESYLKMFRLLKSAVPRWKPKHIMADFEIAISKAINEVFPNAKIGGCYYHYSKAVWRKGRALGLTKKRVYRRIVALSAVLPLLPCDKVQEGWVYVQRQITKDIDGKDFVHYFNTFWFKNEEFIKQWNVFGNKHRTNNFAEAWHFKINDKNNRKISIFGLLKKLYKNSVVQNNIYKAMTQKNILKKREKQFIQRDKFIRNAQKNLLQGEMTIGHFLDMMR